MEFDLNKALEILQRTPKVLNELLHNLSDDWSKVNEGGETWSAYDVMGHLIHGENTDWIARVEICLSDGGQKTFTPFDRFAQFEESKGKTLNQLLSEFEQLRNQNIFRLKSYNINKETLTKTAIHPTFGEVNLKNLISTWVVHDLDHLYQISRVMAKQYTKEVGPWIEFIKILRQE